MEGASLFESMPLNESQLTLVTEIQARAAALYQVIEVIKNSREKSLAITNLEQAIMWAIKGISRNP